MSAPGIMPGLERVEALLNRMGNPEKKLPCVHVAGTNGKGSTVVIIAGILRAAGLRVGSFMSPPLHSIREMITINGVPIAGDSMITCLEEIEADIKAYTGNNRMKPSEFEILTALAFKYFVETGADFMVAEAGMGGLNDATNVVMPRVSVITPITLEHSAYLGGSLEAIAAHKAGIIKPGVPVVAGCMAEPAFKVICDIAAEKNAPLYRPSLVKDTIHDEQYVNFEFNGRLFEHVFFSLPGYYQLKNLGTALTVIDILQKQGVSVSEDRLRSALSSLRQPGRLEKIKEDPDVILDAAHNPGAAAALAVSLERMMPERRKVMVCGLLDDKDAYGYLAALGIHTGACLVTRPDHERTSRWERVKDAWDSCFPANPALLVEEIEQAVKQGLAMLQPGDYLLVTGWFYILDRARKYLMRN